MSRSLHDKRNKTQKVFRGWDYSEIIEWMEVDYKDSIFKMIKYRLSNFFKVMKKAFKDLFTNRYMDEDDRENIATKKALDYLMSNMYDSTNIKKEYKEKVDGLRTYVTKLAKHDNTYIQPLWKGLSEIKSDSEFVRYVSFFLESLWD